MQVYGHSRPSRGHSKCKGPEAGACLVDLRNSKASVWLRVSKQGRW